jgi:hypothetical protein
MEFQPLALGFFLPVVKYHDGGVDFWMKTASMQHNNIRNAQS